MNKQQIAAAKVADKKSMVAIENNAASERMSRIMELAVDPNMDVEKLQKLLDMQRQHESELASKAFEDALINFQYECPVIEKKRKADFGGKGAKFAYASLEDVVTQIKEPMFKNGLNYRWEQSVNEQGGIRIACILTHRLGHSKTCAFIAAPDGSGSKNFIQAAASSVTYMKRYTLCGVLGIATADEDTDGVLPREEVQTKSGALNDALTQDNQDFALAQTAMEKATTLSELQTAAEFLKKLPDGAKKAAMRKIYTAKRKEITANAVAQ